MSSYPSYYMLRDLQGNPLDFQRTKLDYELQRLQSIGLMDRDNLYAAYHFAQLASRNGLRPLIGMEANLFYEGRKTSFSSIS